MPIETRIATPTAAIGELPLAQRQIPALESSIAGFAGFAPVGPLDRAVRVDSWDAFAAAFADPARPQAGPYLPGAKLAHSVRGFFRNGGRTCWVARVGGVPGASTVADHLEGLRLLTGLDEPSVIALPDAYGVATGAEGARAIQHELVASCERVVGRLVIVDPPPGLDPAGALAWRSASRIDSGGAAAYYPWIETLDPAEGATVAIPPCGHAAGLWARVDSHIGLQRAPTSEALLAADGGAAALTGIQQHHLNRAGINCLRAWPGPELRVWGACTLSTDPEQRYLHRQRIVGHLVASIAQGTRWAADEPDDERARESLRATVTAFLAHAWRDGVLLGDSAAQAFFVRCDEALADTVARSHGDLVLEIGLSVRHGGSFRVLRINHRPGFAP